MLKLETNNNSYLLESNRLDLNKMEEVMIDFSNNLVKNGFKQHLMKDKVRDF